MISIKESVQNILNKDLEGKNSLVRGILNLSQYARTIQSDVAEQAKKEVSVQSIVVTLARLEKRLHAYNYLPEVKIQQLSVHSPITQIIFDKNQENLGMLASAIKKIQKSEDIFSSFSTSTRDIAIIVSASLENEILKEFTTTPKLIKRDLSAVSIRFGKEYVEQAGVGLSLLHKISLRNVPLDAATTTYHEFTIVFEVRYLQDVIEVLNQDTQAN